MSEKQYEIFWDEKVSYQGYVWAESEEEAIKFLRENGPDDYDVVNSEYMGDVEIIEVE